jgi:hypothetical protein
LIFFSYFAGLPLRRGRLVGGGVAGKKATLLLLTRVTRWFFWASSPQTMLPVA